MSRSDLFGAIYGAFSLQMRNALTGPLLPIAPPNATQSFAKASATIFRPLDRRITRRLAEGQRGQKSAKEQAFHAWESGFHDR
jgi:hypothetical protein